MRVNVTLACTECGDRNYITTKNKRNNPERIEMKNIVHVITNKLYIVKLNILKVKGWNKIVPTFYFSSSFNY